jgi:hypothetical protein
MPYMERKVAVRLGDGTHNRKAGLPIEQLVADNQDRAAPFLFMTRLGGEGDRDKIASTSAR